MQIIETVEAMRRARSTAKDSVGLVPTMGALHEGHLSLVRAAKASCETVVVSLFVNPLQFGPNEDYDRYPRTFEADCAMLQAEGVDFVFAPSVEEMYPHGAETIVRVEQVATRLDGASRPGHFDGVATVVSKLFHIVRPDKAYFGQKDAAQVAVLKTMVRDLNFNLHMVVCPIVREEDGLAMSSRNRYLSAEERTQALVLSHALQTVDKTIHEGQYSAEVIQEILLNEIDAATEVQLDYVAVVDAQSLLPVEQVKNGTLVAVAAWVGATRLIDNILVGGIPDEAA